MTSWQEKKRLEVLEERRKEHEQYAAERLAKVNAICKLAWLNGMSYGQYIAERSKNMSDTPNVTPTAENTPTDTPTDTPSDTPSDTPKERLIQIIRLCNYDRYNRIVSLIEADVDTPSDTPPDTPPDTADGTIYNKGYIIQGDKAHN